MSTPTSGSPLAVVIGASSGIGYELAAQLTETCGATTARRRTPSGWNWPRPTGWSSWRGP
ncbi:hypothetical protein FXF50_01885 [Micromonospora sp. AP08]|uniref:hypothetical protein n=1 Tax=Micromonospora sp. AP08 TaxID=2604467 RepID=UPI0011D54C8A|nr:hypothetical protein [Micromonospora sp. AP08]TYB40491.1 hypothetical protein FXF50_01885 [Micromonospora sp. AP08]